MSSMLDEFERFFESALADAERQGDLHAHTFMRTFKNAHYAIWVASRKALVVELPEERSTTGKHFDAWSYAQDYNDGIDACREALAKAGVTVK